MNSLKHFRTVITQGVTVATIMAGGDIMSQTLIEKKKYDVKRTIRFASIGLFFVGPTLHFWYMTLERIVPPQKSVFKRGIHKMLYDQIFCAPIFSLAITVVFSFVNGDSTARIKERVINDYPGMMMKNYMLWPAAQIINFSVIPNQYQVVFCQVVAIIWNCILSQTLNS